MDFCIRLRQVALVGLLSLFYITSTAQTRHNMFAIAKTADVFDRAEELKHKIDTSLYRIPEFRAKDGKLEVDLYISEETYKLGEDSIRMRTYSFMKDGRLSKIGPFGPTLRVGRSDRLTVRLHNNLPDVADMDYYGSMPQNLKDSMDYYGSVFNTTTTTYKVDSTLVTPAYTGKNKKKRRLMKAVYEYEYATETRTEYKEISSYMKKMFVQYSDSSILETNLVGATIEIIEEGKEWVLHGKVECECPPYALGTCEKKPIEYPIIDMWNTGTQERALRIYINNAHSGVEHDHNIPHGFNTTNLHAHGFHISPYQDDVFRKVEPGLFSYYTYDLKDHTPGTMWYHPHVHGSTAVQVASGMSGAIIIEDDAATLRKFPLLAEASKKKNERIMLFNQIHYDDSVTHECTDFTMMRNTPYAQGTTINGVVQPRVQMQTGTFQRWRLVHSAYDSDLILDFPAEVEVYQIAVDGIMFDKMRKIETLHMAPGNRTDLLVRVNRPGAFKVKSSSYLQKCEYFPNDPDCARESDPLQRDSLETILVINANGRVARPGNVVTRLPGPIGHSPIDSTQLANPKKPRTTVFDIILSTDTTATKYVVDGASFEHGVISHTLKLGDYEQWVASSPRVADHPFHIHVNPFLVVKCGDKWLETPIWKDVAMSVTPDAVDPANGDILFYTHYYRYTGDFVMHCHILHHEDNGMMQRIRIIGEEKEE